MDPFNRRDFLRTAALAGAMAPAAVQAAQAAPQTAPVGLDADGVRWLDTVPPAAHEGQTFGLPWPRGTQKAKASFTLSSSDGQIVPVQTWPLAYWPDGSLKWTGHAIPADAGRTPFLKVTPGKPVAPTGAVSVRETPDAVEIVAGEQSWLIPRKGPVVIARATVAGRETLRDVCLVALTQDKPDFDDGPVTETRFEGEVTSLVVEQKGPVRAVVKLEGKHCQGDRAWLPFTLRLYVYAGARSLRIMHSFVFDGDENRDFIRGLGLVGKAPLTDALYDRHVRFSGEGDGVWGEGIRPLTGLRRDPGKAWRDAQVAGQKTPGLEGMAPTVSKRLDLIPAWGDFTLSQPNSDGFSIKKRTKAGHGWIDAVTSGRATGLGYIGGASGGVAFALTDFWKRCPTRLDIRHAQTDAAEFTVWLWSPDAPAMDLRFYHDGLGMTDHAAEREGLEITYEDYEKNWGRPLGIARTNEITLWALPTTPSRQDFAAMAGRLRETPRLVATPARLKAAQVFGLWSPVDRSTPTRRVIEDQNDGLLAFYMKDVEQRRWYGFWNHGDVMHTYDSDRHVWRYDIGGFAWANSELSPDLWLWLSFVRSGRADVFRLAEAMTRHTGEVDVCHLGPYKGLGTRHGVQHWADSSKQPRVSNAAYRRYYYYLTADERVGDLMHDLVGSDESLTRVDISRKLPGAPQSRPEGAVDMGFGTSWSALAAAWLTEWERTGDKRWRDRITAGMDSIAAMKQQWFAGGADFDLKTGKFLGKGETVSVSHLNAVFGAVETHAELFQLIEDHPAYRNAWLDYCQFYNAPDAEFRAKTGAPAKGRNLKEGHSRLTAYAAVQRKDPALAQRAWQEFFSGDAGLGIGAVATERRIDGPAVIEPIIEIPRVSTNASSQWGLAAIQNLALVGDALEAARANLPAPKARGQDLGKDTF
ncbi:exo-rhamnogalacturonan lyase family protein [Caulobacter hibisci]|uniref:Tat pathway signal sequence domain protein n=1 Tax=Caulobacter hibisci TaxID=2035993 RepID=A0ABS0STD1_9CAUL|nr:Tat pathway signal sequence domain protein [Caulobacter hibisci]MBI1682853.1 Tat pathway signal sequence domain protein [Caulobacter hibisci]